LVAYQESWLLSLEIAYVQASPRNWLTHGADHGAGTSLRTSADPEVAEPGQYRMGPFIDPGLSHYHFAGTNAALVLTAAAHGMLTE
jgi:hypothetical protein